VLFVVAIVGLVAYLAVTKADLIDGSDGRDEVAVESDERGGLWQTVTVVGLLLAFRVAGYLWRKSVLEADVPAAVATAVAPQAGAARLKPRDKAAWTALDKKIDTALRAISATSPDPAAAAKAALSALLDAIGR
jgi:hypothetical protein